MELEKNSNSQNCDTLWQITAFAYDSASQLSDVFAGRAAGYIYTRLSNPTTAALEMGLTKLEDGIGCIATASGMAAISSAVMALLSPGDEAAVQKGIFGGTVSLFDRTLSKFGIKARYFSGDDPEDLRRVLNDRTKLVFAETIANPGMCVASIAEISAITKKRGIPLMVDNTVLPGIFKPADLGADIVVCSTSKYINGNGTAIGGAIVDAGSYDWSNGRFPEISRLTGKFRQLAFLGYLRTTVFRDIGGCAAPMNSYLMLKGLETLNMRMERHCDNGRLLAEFLSGHEKVSWVNYPGLAGSKDFSSAEIFQGRGGGLVTVGLGSEANAAKMIDSLSIAKIKANLGETGTLVIHPYSTIFHEFTEQRKEQLGISSDMVRISVGLEDIEVIKKDFENAIEKI